ncbi:MAG: thioredoxin family protein [Candidatus Izimaplasma sp.]|nr:thioredoxin family protein [Candidatus Izimaplasma bacterium]
MKQIESLEEFEAVINNEKITITYWYTDWCPDCFAIKPYLEPLQDEFDSIQFVQVDRDEMIDLAKHYDVMGIPSFIIFKEGDVIGRLVDKNRKTYEQVKSFIQETI